MTDLETLAELRRLHEAATPAPWDRWKEPFDRGVYRIRHTTENNRTIVGGTSTEANAALIVALRNTLPAILAALAPVSADVEAVAKRLIGATVASCTCDVKTPELKYHAEDCRYRILSEAASLLRYLARERDKAARKADHWHDCFRVLNKAVVGETGASAIEEAPKLRARAEAAEHALEHEIRMKEEARALHQAAEAALASAHDDERDRIVAWLCNGGGAVLGEIADDIASNVHRKEQTP